MRTRHVAMAALMLGACRTPYRPAGSIGGNGYRDSEIGPGIHMIEVRVTPRTGYAVAHQYAHRRARELCPNGYDLADSSTTTSTAVYASSGTVMVANRPVALIVVQCR